jgi:8-oxo-dGTP pyrophosphatase MutT (NUDIX family)
MSADLLLSATARLRAGDAVAAILVLDDGRYLLQQRDELPTIWYPGHWGCFGGAIDPGEGLEAALERELLEELALARRPLTYFARFDFDLSKLGQGRVHRTYFTASVDADEVKHLQLREGAGFDAFQPEDMFARLRLTPYDAFALWLHVSRGRLTLTETAP